MDPSVSVPTSLNHRGEKVLNGNNGLDIYLTRKHLEMS
jgi:hypothetical protein